VSLGICVTFFMCRPPAHLLDGNRFRRRCSILEDDGAGDVKHLALGLRVGKSGARLRKSRGATRRIGSRPPRSGRTRAATSLPSHREAEHKHHHEQEGNTCGAVHKLAPYPVAETRRDRPAYVTPIPASGTRNSLDRTGSGGPQPSNMPDFGSRFHLQDHPPQYPGSNQGFAQRFEQTHLAGRWYLSRYRKKASPSIAAGLLDAKGRLKGEFTLQAHGSGAGASVMRVSKIWRRRARGILNVEHIHVQPRRLVGVI